MSDIDRLVLLGNNKNIADNLRDIFPHPYTRVHAESFVKLNQKEGFEYNFAIEYQYEFIGMIGAFKQTDVFRKSAELGYWIGEPYWGRGIVTQCITLLTKHIFVTTDIHRVFAKVFEFNKASMKVLDKCGFALEGIAKKSVCKNDKLWDEYLYAILASS